MDTQHIISELTLHHDAFVAKLESLSDQDFIRQAGNKWTAGQQLEHIIKSVKPIDKAFSLPLFVLKMKFGTTDRSNKTYADLVAEYLEVLKENQDYVLPEQFAPEQIPPHIKHKKMKELVHLIKSINRSIGKIADIHLNTHILPHPVMGKLTLREMLYFTIYHVQHHDAQILENLKIKK